MLLSQEAIEKTDSNGKILPEMVSVNQDEGGLGGTQRASVLGQHGVLRRVVLADPQLHSVPTSTQQQRSGSSQQLGSAAGTGGTQVQAMQQHPTTPHAALMPA